MGTCLLNTVMSLRDFGWKNDDSIHSAISVISIKWLTDLTDSRSITYNNYVMVGSSN